MEATSLRIGLVGYGEVGTILTRGLRERGVAWVGVWDRLLPGAGGAAMRAEAAAAGAHAMASLAALLACCDVVICAVTASQALAVAREAAPAIGAGTWFVDVNSASPGTKGACARLLDAAGGRYVDAAVMTSVPPHGIAVPILVGGPHAAALRDLLTPLGFRMDAVSERVGVASAIKMCRSVVVKGLEALVVESFTAARRYGVEERVLASLAETFPAFDWDRQGAYLMSRAAMHGRRRAEEMREVAVTVREAGVQPWLAAAIVERQDDMGRRNAAGIFDGLTDAAGWRAYADRMLASDAVREAPPMPVPGE